jgi:AraC family transcriptional regulator
MEPKIVSKPAFTAVGIKYRGKNEHNEIPALWDNQFLPRVEEIQHRLTPPASYGIMDNYDSASGEFDYLAGVEVDDATGVPPGMISWHVPAQTYAVFTTKLATLMATFDQIHAWLPSSGYQRADGPEFELYDENFMGDDSDMYVCIPIKR